MLRLHERIRVSEVYGRPWGLLAFDEQMHLLGYESLRQLEERGPLG